MSLWRVDEAAAYLGIRPKTLYEWVRTGRVPHRKLGFNVRFDPAELAAWVQEQGESAKSGSGGRGGADARHVRTLITAAGDAVRQLRKIETDLGAQLSFPERQKLKELADRLQKAAGHVEGS